MLVQNGEVKGYPRPIPEIWENISNFHVLDSETHRKYGWYPLRVVPSQKGENDVVIGQEFIIEGDEVVQYEKTRPKTAEELEQEMEKKWEEIRIKRNGLLTKSDWTQLVDSPLPYDEKKLWGEYRQKLRDVTGAQTPDEIVWPEKPNGVVNE